MIAGVIVGLLNLLGTLLPQLPSLIAEIKASTDLSDHGKAALALIEPRLVADEKAVEAIQPLPVPDAPAPG